MTDLVEIEIEDRVYACQRFNSMDCVAYGTQWRPILYPEGGEMADVASTLKNPSLTAMLRQAIGQCFTPQNESLADEAVFNQWFTKYPGDMFILGLQATVALIHDFLPSVLAMASVQEGHA